MSYSCRQSHILGSKTVWEGLLINSSRCGRTYWADSAILRILVLKCCGAQTRHRCDSLTSPVCVTAFRTATTSSNKNAKCKHFEHHGSGKKFMCAQRYPNFMQASHHEISQGAGAPVFAHTSSVCIVFLDRLSLNRMFSRKRACSRLAAKGVGGGGAAKKSHQPLAKAT